MKISLIQTKQNVLYDFANDPQIAADVRRRLAAETVSRAAQLAEEAARGKCDYIITTEAVNFTGVPMDRELFDIIEPFGGPSFDAFKKIAKKYSVNICAGLYNRRQDKAYNSAVLFDRGGNIEVVYDKVNLAGSENEMLTAGEKYLVIDTEFGKIAPLICWDMQCGAASEAAGMGADIIFCPTWGWEHGYGIACAADNGVYVAAAMAVPYNGDISGARNPSEILDRTGKILVYGSTDGECIVTKDVRL